MRQAVSRMEEELANAETAFRACVALCPYCPSDAQSVTHHANLGPESSKSGSRRGSRRGAWCRRNIVLRKHDDVAAIKWMYKSVRVSLPPPDADAVAARTPRLRGAVDDDLAVGDPGDERGGIAVGQSRHSTRGGPACDGGAWEGRGDQGPVGDGGVGSGRLGSTRQPWGRTGVGGALHAQLARAGRLTPSPGRSYIFLKRQETNMGPTCFPCCHGDRL